MTSKPKQCLCFICCFCLFIAALALCTFNVSPAQAQGEVDELEQLDAAAKLAYTQGDFEEALEKYRELEHKLPKYQMATRQVDLLHNQAIIYLELQQYGQAAARLQQIQVTQPSPQNAQMLSETRHIIEYKAYQKNPNTAFIRGNTNCFSLWIQSHRIKLRPLTITTLISWTCLLASLLSLYFFRKSTRWAWVTKIISSLGAIFFLVVFTHLAMYKLTDNDSYAVVTTTDNVRLEPRLSAKPLNNAADLPGLVVRILIQNDQWVLAERSDKKTAWMPKADLYILSGAE